MKCPLGLCDGSGFIRLVDFDGPGLDDEDNCVHTDYPEVVWTPELIAEFMWHYNTAHVFGGPECAWCQREKEEA